MTFTVHGYVDGVTYGVVVDPDREADDDDGVVVQASPRTPLSIVAVHVGETAQLTATGDHLTISLDDPHALLAGLMKHTEVTRITGDYPQHESEVTEPNTVY